MSLPDKRKLGEALQLSINFLNYFDKLLKITYWHEEFDYKAFAFKLF